MRTFYRKLFPVFLLLFLLPALSAAESALSRQLTGYFTDHLYLRPAMVQTTDYVDVIPPYTLVTVETLDGTWGAVTSSRGITGYVKYGRMQPPPEITPEADRSVYCEKAVRVRTLPVYEAPAAFTAEADELLTVDGSSGAFLHVRREDGQEGFVLPGWVKKAEFSPQAISPVTFCVAEAVTVHDLPLRGAHPVGRLDPAERYTASEACGNYYLIQLDGQTAFVDKGSVGIFACRGGASRSFFSFPRGSGGRSALKKEDIYASALISAPGARFFLPDGTERNLPEGAMIYLYEAFGDWAGGVYGQEAGYLARAEAKVLSSEALQARLSTLDLSGGSIARSALLDQGFALLERGNPFQARYNLLTGASVESLFPLGVPYFWGGRSYAVTTERLPDYTTREAWQSSPSFYEKGVTYLYGFDCIGLVKAVYRLAGRPIEGEVVAKGEDAWCLAGAHVFCDDVHPVPEDWKAVARTMQVGDVMVIHHPGTHAMMYMGTLRQYGYTAAQLPALADYLDYPLMLQSGANPYSYLRFDRLISTSSDARVRSASPSDGGAGVCILGVPRSEAELELTCHEDTYYGFDVEGSFVPIMYWGNVRDYFVWRPEGAVTAEARLLALQDEPEFVDPEAAVEITEIQMPDTVPEEVEIIEETVP